jgi:hypothetical protein
MTATERPPSVRRARFVAADPEVVAGEILEANGTTFAQLAAAEVVALVEGATR